MVQSYFPSVLICHLKLQVRIFTALGYCILVDLDQNAKNIQRIPSFTAISHIIIHVFTIYASEDIFNDADMTKVVLLSLKNMVGKGDQHFFPFTPCFQKLSSQGS